jgi:hypothetical protein
MARVQAPQTRAAAAWLQPPPGGEAAACREVHGALQVARRVRPPCTPGVRPPCTPGVRPPPPTICLHSLHPRSTCAHSCQPLLTRHPQRHTASAQHPHAVWRHTASQRWRTRTVRVRHDGLPSRHCLPGLLWQGPYADRPLPKTMRLPRIWGLGIAKTRRLPHASHEARDLSRLSHGHASSPCVSWAWCSAAGWAASLGVGGGGCNGG